MTYETVLASLLSSIFGGFIVVLSTHIMTKRREQEKRLSDLRIEHLISCWKKIERAAVVGHDTINANDKRERYDDLEEAIASIMLLGDRSEVDAASKFAKELAAGSSASTNMLLNTLRKSLRAKLNLENVSGLDVFFRMRRDDGQSLSAEQKD